MGISDYLAELVHAQLEERKPLAIPDGITIEEITDIAKRNHMEYLLLGALLRADNLSADDIGQLRGSVMHSLTRTMAQVTEFRELEKSFEEAGIKNQAMKGARMRFLYPAPQLREMSDVDILIDSECMKQAAQLLEEKGYTLVRSIKHHDIYKKPPFMVVEAHKVMYDKTVDGGQYKYFSNFSKAVLQEGKKYTYDFNREDFYIYMMAHMAKHFENGGCGIKPFTDLWFLNSTDGETVERREALLSQGNLLRFAQTAQKLSRVWFDNEEMDCLSLEMENYVLNGGSFGSAKNRISVQQQKKGGKFRYLWSKIFIPYDEIKFFYPILQKYRFLTPFMEVYRWLKLIFGGRLKSVSKELEMNQSVSVESKEFTRDFLVNIGLLNDDLHGFK